MAAAGAAWNPWRALREQGDIELEWAELNAGTDGLAQQEGSRRRIVLRYDLTRVERNAVLAHELIHHERGILFDETTPPPLIEKEEATVRAICTDRLVPPDRLAEFLSMWDPELIGVSARMVAEEFDVPEDIAAHALERFKVRELDR